jgi:DNA (cytosine-5)-methyltransferase 1
LRIGLDARECGLRQIRPRVFQFGHVAGQVPIVTRRRRLAVDSSRCAMASEFSRPGRRGWPEFCELQGLPRDFALPGFTLSAKYRAVGNGVAVPVARAIAAAVRDARALVPGESLCRCGCGRIVAGRRELATVACRKRTQRKRDAAAVTVSDPVTPATSRLIVGSVAARAAGDVPASPLALPVKLPPMNRAARRLLASARSRPL